MKLRKGTKAEPSRRQRFDRDQGSSTNYSYYNRRSQTTTNTGRDTARDTIRQAAQKHGSFWMQRFGLGVLLIVSIFCLMSSVRLTNDAKVVPLADSNSSALLQNPAVYQSVANEFLEGSALNRTKITIDTEKLANKIEAQFPEVRSANVVLPLLANRPIIYLQPVQPVLVMSTPNGSFVIDSTGKALLPSASLDAAQRESLLAVIDQSGLSVEANKQVLPSSTVAFIQTVLLQLKARELSAASLTLPSASQELHVKIADQPFLIKFNLADPLTARAQTGTFIATHSRLKEQGITPGEYIDVRLVGRAYYK